ncbi:MAG: site-specific integrase, partial [Alphaproteobacteria bacterium]
MSRAVQKLSAVAIKPLKKPGRHSDGGGLYLSISKSGSKSWVFMWTRKGVRREMGLGSYPRVSLAVARAKAEKCHSFIEEGKDPIAERDKEAEPTFAECVEMFLAAKAIEWGNAKHRAQWRMTLTEYCKPISAMKISDIGTNDVLKVLNPIWQDRAPTASRLRGRIERVLDFAKVKGWRIGENPALWRGNLKNVLPARNKLSRGHHAAMDYSDIPEFLARVRNADAMAARALEFLILTAARSGEVLGTQWSEIDFEKAIWTAPAARMKAKEIHRVPLSDRAIEILQTRHETRVSDFVFPGQRPNRPLSAFSMPTQLRRMKIEGATVHGFRSSFRDWCGEETHFPREIAEAALAHKVGNEVERAYRRGDALEKRRKLMQA